MSQRIIVGIVKEIFLAADHPLTVVEVNARLDAAGLKLDKEKVRHCIVNLYGRKWLESVTTDYKNGSTYQIYKTNPVAKIVTHDILKKDTRSEFEKRIFPIPTMTGNSRIVTFGEAA